MQTYHQTYPPQTAGLINFVGGEFEAVSYPVVEMNTDAAKKSNGAEPSFPLSFSAAPTMMMPSETLTESRLHNATARRGGA